VAYFVIPAAVGLLIEVVPALKDPSRWFDLGQVTALRGNAPMAAGDWPRLAVALAIWIGLPLVLGLARLRRRELS
jgi:ABC-2 type transport system permease protein